MNEIHSVLRRADVYGALTSVNICGAYRHNSLYTLQVRLLLT